MVEFLQIELDLAFTFCKVGLTTSDFSRAERNADNARTALQTVLELKERFSLTKQEKQTLVRKASAVISILVQLEHHCVRMN